MYWKLPLVIAALLASMTGAALYYRALYLNAEKDQQYWEAQAGSQQAALELLNRQMQTVAALDAKYIRELTDARLENDRLRADLATGTKRLQLNATCSKPVSKTTGPVSVDDVTSPRLNDTAKRDYLSLRERIGIATSQIAGLQDYINNVCLK